MIRLVTLLVLVGVLSLPAHAKESRETVQDTSSSSMSFFEIISWPFIHVIQPFFGSLVYPISAPLHYDRRELPTPELVPERRLLGL